MKKLSTSLSFIILFCTSLIAQIAPNGYNPSSVRQVLDAEIMYRGSIIRRVDLSERNNKSFMPANNELTRVIAEAVRDRKIKAYYPITDPRISGFQASSEMNPEECYQKLTSYFDEDGFGEVSIRPESLHLIDIKEDLIFDRKLARMYWDIQSISIIIPQGIIPETQAGEFTVATFKYSELMTYFRENYEKSLLKGTFEDLRCFWFNPDNPRQHLCLADALELRLFDAQIIKVSNPEDKYIAEIVRNDFGEQKLEKAQEVLKASQKIPYNLIEFEHQLWNLR